MLFENYFNLSSDKKEAFNESLSCFQMSLDLQPKFPTMSMICLFSAMERMAKRDEIETKQSAKWKEVFEFIKKYVSLTDKEEQDLKEILRDSYYRMRSAGVHSAKLRGLEYETSEKKRFYLPDIIHFEPSWLSINWYYTSLKQIFGYTLIEWLKTQK